MHEFLSSALKPFVQLWNLKMPRNLPHTLVGMNSQGDLLVKDTNMVNSRSQTHACVRKLAEFSVHSVAMDYR